MSSGGLEFLAGVLGPGGGLVVEGAGFEAAVQDAGEPVGEVAQRGAVAGPAGALGVVAGAGAGRGAEGGEGLAVEGVAEPVVVHVPGHHGFLLPGLAGDRAGGRVVLAGLRRGVAMRVVAELGQHPGAEDRSQAGLGQDDLSVRVLTEMRVHLPLQHLDLLAEGADHRDQRADHRRAGSGDLRRLGQLLGCAAPP